MSHNIFPQSSGFVPIASTTVLDTLTEPAPIGANQTRQVAVGGVGDVPASGVVPVLSVAALAYSAGFMTLFPAGSAQPNASHFAFDTLSYNADVEVVPIVGGKINVYSSQVVDVRIAVIGHLPLGASFTPVTPARLLDTRFSGALTAGAQRNAGVAGAAAVPVGATDVLALVSTVNASGEGSLSIWESGGASPTSPALRWGSATSTRFVVIHLGNDGQMSLKNTSISSSVDLLVDVVAYFA